MQEDKNLALSLLLNEFLYAMPMFYNFGYTASLAEPNGMGRSIPVTKDEIGLVQVSDEGLNKGIIRVGYQKTTVQKVREGISLFTLFSIILISLLRLKKVKTEETDINA